MHILCSIVDLQVEITVEFCKISNEKCINRFVLVEYELSNHEGYVGMIVCYPYVAVMLMSSAYVMSYMCLGGVHISEVYMLNVGENTSFELALCRCCVSKSYVSSVSLDVICNELGNSV